MNSKNIFPLFIAIIISCSLSSIANSSPTTISSQPAKFEDKRLGTLIVLNENEIVAGELATKKSSNYEVKNFAAFMIKEHSDNLNKTIDLGKKLRITPVEDKLALKLKNKGKMESASLNRLSGTIFDKAYMKAMVKDHKEALAVVNILLSKTSNILIKTHLKNTKKHIEHHLDRAQALQATLH